MVGQKQLIASDGFRVGQAAALWLDNKAWYSWTSPANSNFERADAIEEQGSFEQAFEEITTGGRPDMSSA